MSSTMEYVLVTFVVTRCRNLNFLIVHDEWMEFQPSAMEAALLKYHCGGNGKTGTENQKTSSKLL